MINFWKKFFSYSFFGFFLFLPFKGETRSLVDLSNKTSQGVALSLDQLSLMSHLKYLPAVDLYIADERCNLVLDQLRKQGLLEKEEAESEIQLEALPNDPLLASESWILSEGPLNLGISQAWDVVTGDDRIVVAIIDTGIDTKHPDLYDNLWTNKAEIPNNGIDEDRNGYVDDVHGYNFRNQNNDVEDDNNHGSHLAGIIGAVGNNGVGIAGINWHVQLMPLKFTDSHGKGTTLLAVEAIDYAIQNGARIINASWTLKAEGSGEETLLRKAIQKAGEAGVLFVTAAGNQSGSISGVNIDEDPIYPASFLEKDSLVVSALDTNGEMAHYSNYGAHTVDLAAPGSSIFSTLSHGGYGTMSGTSMATAFVSGAASLILSLDSGLHPADVKKILKNSAVSSPLLEGKVMNASVLNLEQAVQQSFQSLQAPSFPKETTSTINAEIGGCSLVR